MSSGNKFAVLAEVNDKKRTVVVTTDGNLPRKVKKEKPAGEAAAKPAAAKPAAAKPAAAKPAAAKKPAVDASGAPSDLKAAMEFNRKKAEERAVAKAEADAKKAEAEAKRAEAAAAKAAAAAEAAAAAGTEGAEGEAPAATTEGKTVKVAEAPAKHVMTMDMFNKERTENRFAIAAKAQRAVNTGALGGLKKMEAEDEELKIVKKAPAPKPAAKPAAKGAKPTAAVAVAPKAEKKEKAEKVDLFKFSDFGGHAGSEGRGRGRGYNHGYGASSGRGGYRGNDHHHSARVPNVEDKRSFPSL